MKTDNIYWYGHASFRIEDNGKQLFFDPWKIQASAPKADYIFITHSHYDHYSAGDVENLSGENTKIFCSSDVADKEGKAAIPMSPNQTIKHDALKITAIPAYNIDKQFHPKENNWVGYVITLSDGTTIYFAGDTDFIHEIKSLQVDIALLPVSGTYVMNAEEAIEAANTFKPKIAIPMHFGDIVGSLADAEKFKQGFDGETVILKPVK